MSFGIQNLKLTHFRNFDSLGLDLNPGFTILAGENAQGKTSFLEAVYWLATTRMLRGKRDSEAIQEGASFCRAETELVTGTSVAAILEVGSRKKFFLNGAGLPRASDILGRLPTVSISIFDLEIVRGEPSERRLFLDLELSSLYSAYLRHLSVYKRAVEQRNALLKMAQEQRIDDYAFESWEEQIALHGSAMRKTRNDYISELNPVAARFHSQMASREELLTLRYVTKDEAFENDALRSLLATTRQQDIYRGSTQVGPHRDDLEILIDGKEARIFGSQGQQRTAVIALKLATLELATATLGSPPILLLDDMLSDLDPVRRAKLCTVVCEQAGQAILTCTEADAAGKEILDRADVIQVQNGTVRRES